MIWLNIPYTLHRGSYVQDKCPLAHNKATHSIYIFLINNLIYQEWNKCVYILEWSSKIRIIACLPKAIIYILCCTVYLYQINYLLIMLYTCINKNIIVHVVAICIYVYVLDLLKIQNYKNVLQWLFYQIHELSWPFKFNMQSSA
jgi:hypothetical protein